MAAQQEQEAIDKLCKAVWEMNRQAPHDFCGEQREFYLPRLNEAMMAAAKLFPAQFARTIGLASAALAKAQPTR